MNNLFKLLIIYVSVTICSCGSEPGCGYVENANTANFQCYVADRLTKKSLMSSYGSIYDNTFSSLLNEQGGNALPEQKITNEGEMLIPLTRHGADSIGIIITKIYYLHLVDVNMVEKDVDTLKFSYELYNTENCRNIDFKNFRCYFNDSLYVSEYPWNKSSIIFYK